MTLPNAQTVTNLQTSCRLFAALSGQFQIDVIQLRAIDLDWLANRVKRWYGHAEDHLRLFAARLIYIGVDPEYDPGAVTGFENVEAFLTRSQESVYAAFDQICQFRRAAWDARADGLPDLYEHAIQYLEKTGIKIDRELKLIALLGDEAGYIAARLEDGE